MRPASRRPEIAVVQRSDFYADSLLHKTRMCRYNATSRCTFGENCRFAHSVQELRPQPDLRRTKLCPRFQGLGTCDDSSCSFAHSSEELRMAARAGLLAAGRSAQVSCMDPMLQGMSGQCVPPGCFNRNNSMQQGHLQTLTDLVHRFPAPHNPQVQACPSDYLPQLSVDGFSEGTLKLENGSGNHCTVASSSYQHALEEMNSFETAGSLGPIPNVDSKFQEIQDVQLSKFSV